MLSTVNKKTPEADKGKKMKLIGYNKLGQERWANFPAVHGKYKLPADGEFIQVGKDWETPAITKVK